MGSVDTMLGRSRDRTGHGRMRERGGDERPRYHRGVTAVLGIDLASARWSSNGSALLHYDRSTGAFTRVVPGRHRVARWA